MTPPPANLFEPAGAEVPRMKVGVLCEFSGTVRDAFIRRGREALAEHDHHQKARRVLAT